MSKRLSLFTSDRLIKKIEKKFKGELNNIREYKTPVTTGQGTVRIKEGDECLNKNEQFNISQP